MGFVDVVENAQVTKQAGSKLQSRFGSLDVNTSQGLLELAQNKGIEVQPKQELGLFQRGIKTASDILLYPSRKVAGLMQTVKGVTSDKMDKDALPSDILYGKTTPQDGFWNSIKHQFTTLDGLKRLATDIVLDPLTYLTLGTGSAIKVATKEGAKVMLEKSGKELLKDLAEEMVQKGMSRKMAVLKASESVAELASPVAKKTLAERGGLELISKGLGKVGRKVTATEVKQVVEGGLKEMVRKPAVRFAGQKIIEHPTFTQAFKGVTEAMVNSPVLKPLGTSLEVLGKTAHGLFDRDFLLPETFKPIKQAFIDSFDATESRVRRNVQTVYGGLSKEARKQITYAIEKGEIKSLPKELQAVANRTKSILASVAREEDKRQLLHSTLDDYVSHIYKNKEKAKTLVSEVRQGQPSALLRFDKTRTLPDLETAKSLGLDPIDDIGELMYIRLMASEKSKLTQDIFGGRPGHLSVLQKTMGASREMNSVEKLLNIKKTNPELARKILETKDAFVPLGEGMTGVPKEFKNILLPQTVVEDIAALGKRAFSDESVKLLIKGYDKALNYWKGSVTVMFPAFHFRNAISNVMQNFLDIGVNAINPVIHSRAFQILTGADGELVTDLGERLSYQEIRRAAKQTQVFQDNLARTDIGRTLDQNVMRKANPYDLGRKAGRSIENEARMVNFITNLKRGYTFKDAADRTKQFLFDYDNLSLFEKDYLRRAIPFYTWTRKNLALQLKALASQPGKQAAVMKMYSTLNDMFGHELTPEEKEFTPQWIQQGLNILVDRKGDDRTFLVGFDLPIEDLFEKTTAMTDNPFRTMLNMTAPFLKIMVEKGTGTNLFSQKQISEDDSGYFAKNYPDIIKKYLDYKSYKGVTKDGREYEVMTVDPNKKWIFNNVMALSGGGRAMSAGTVDGMVSLYHLFKGDDISISDRASILRLFTGVRSQTINLEREKAVEEKKQKEQIASQIERSGEVREFQRYYIPKKNNSSLKKRLQ